MILISCRRNFDSNQLFSDDNEIRNYPSLANLKRYETLSEGDFQDTVANGHVLVLIHGYRNPIRNVARAYGLIERRLDALGLLDPPHYSHVVGFLWPGFQTAAGFILAVPWANRSSGYFRQLLQVLKPSAKTTDIQAHSLGARVGLQAVAFEHDGLWIDNMMLMAAAIDNESLEPKEEFNGSLDSCRRCLVYHSSQDNTLRHGYRIAALDRALGYKGPQHPKVIEQKCPEVHVVDCSKPVGSHGGYRRSARVYAHWKRVLSVDPLPRFETLSK